MAHQGVTGTHSAVCLEGCDDGKNTLSATCTNFGDGTYEWQCHKNPAHHGYGEWPKGSPAYEHAVNPGKGPY
jgi:hypothetical protein